MQSNNLQMLIRRIQTIETTCTIDKKYRQAAADCKRILTAVAKRGDNTLSIDKIVELIENA